MFLQDLLFINVRRTRKYSTCKPLKQGLLKIFL